jgi:hypothetical protein
MKRIGQLINEDGTFFVDRNDGIFAQRDRLAELLRRPDGINTAAESVRWMKDKDVALAELDKEKS